MNFMPQPYYLFTFSDSGLSLSDPWVAGIKPTGEFVKSRNGRYYRYGVLAWIKPYIFSYNIIKNQFPNVRGLYDPTLGWDLEFPAAPSEKLIQIIRDDKGHWVVASKSKGEDFVSIYDSFGGSAINQHIIGCISSLLRTNRSSFKYQSVGC